MKGGEKVSAINELRKDKGLSIGEFAKALGLSESYITKLLYNKRPMTLNVIRRVLEAFPDADATRLI